MVEYHSATSREITMEDKTITLLSKEPVYLASFNPIESVLFAALYADKTVELPCGE